MYVHIFLGVVFIVFFLMIMNKGIKREMTNLGLIKCVTVNKAPSTTQMPLTTTYAIPRKGFLPPMTVRVEMMMDFVPPYTVAGKSD